MEPFKHKDGSLVFVTQKDVYEYYKSKAWDSEAYKAHSNFESPELIDTYYMDAIDKAESKDEIEKLFDRYTDIIEQRFAALDKLNGAANRARLLAAERLENN